MESKNSTDIFQNPHTTIITSVNTRGRPKKHTEIRFTSQPKSIVSQLLSKIKADECNLTLTIDLNQPSQQDYEDVQIVEDEKNEDIEQKMEFNCHFCTYRSDDIREQKKHMKTHKQFICDYPNCSYSCKLSSNLTKHKRIHTGEKPYLCEQCSFRSNFINSLKVHKRTHTLERPYACKNCNYRSNSSWNLKKHCYHRHIKPG